MPPPWSYSYPWGIFHNLVPHGLYYAREFAGEPVKLVTSARSARRVPESAFDELLVTMDGTVARARIALSLATAPERNTLTLSGTKASVVADTNLLTAINGREGILPSPISRSVWVVDHPWQLVRCSEKNRTGYAL